jgi:acyl transferase domain-containing protein
MTTGEPDRRQVLQRALVELKQLRARVEADERTRSEPIAVIGVGCRFPGGGNDPDAYWRLLRNGVDAVTEVPPTRWDVDAFFDADPDAPGKTYTRRGGFLDLPIETFDALFFNIPPREAVKMDPQHRLLLEVAWEALERAGIPPTNLVGSRTSVFIGMSNNDYVQRCLLHGDPGAIDAYVGTGNPLNCAAGRLAFVLGLQGPSLAVDTACSSSLVALHLACQSLRSNESQLALVGGVNLILSPEVNVALCKARMLAPDGRCKTFAANADGYGRGEGCGVVVLKRVSTAIADGDPILALVRGSAVNQNGPSSGLTVPSGQAQQALIREALANAGVAPSEVQYVETHGTGTSLGDPIEVRALAAVLAEGRPPDSPVAIGSVKANIGHLESAAGIAGLIKVILAMQHAEIPPQLLSGERNPHVDWDQLPVRIPTRRTAWPSGSGPRFAGVSSFGFSGTNAHVILEAAPDPEPLAPRIERPQHLVALSARSHDALCALAGQLGNHVSAAPADSLIDVCATVNLTRSSFEHRLGVVAASAPELGDKLAEFAAGTIAPGVVTGEVRGPGNPAVAFLFTGQGAQWVGMGRQLYETQPRFRATLDRCDELLRPHLDRGLLSIISGSPVEGATNLDETIYTQPALFALEYALAELWQSWGIEPSFVAGHSVGEYVAACVAGVFGLEDGLRLIAQRARLMQSLPRGGAMAAVFADEARVMAAVASRADTLAVAAVNAPDETVVSGTREAVRAVGDELLAQGIHSRPLAVSHAFHSPLIEPIVTAFRSTAAGVSFAPPRIGVISNVSGQLATGQDLLHADYWSRHLRQPVRFMASMQELHRRGVRTFVEIGPGGTLLGLGQRCLPRADAAWLASIRRGVEDWEQMLKSLAALFVRGAAVDWARVDGPYARHRVVLPTYPFQRTRFWVDSGEPRRSRGGTHPLRGRRISSPLPHVQYEIELRLDSLELLRQHRVYGHAVVPGVVYLQMAMLAAAEVSPVGIAGVEDLSLLEPLVIGETVTRTIQLILEPHDAGTVSFAIHSRGMDDSWRVHVRGRLKQASADEPPPGARVRPAALVEQCPAELSGADFYRDIWSQDFALGPDLQLVERIWRGEGQAVGRLRRPQAATHPEVQPDLLVLDACVQLLVAAIPRRIEAEGRRTLYVGTGQRASHLYRELPKTHVWCHARVVHTDPDAGRCVGDLTVFDDAGTLLAELTGVELKRVRAETLARLTGDEPASARRGPGSLSRLQLVALDVGERRPKLEDYLTESAARVMGMHPSQLDLDQPLLPLLDSLMAVELKSQIELDLECEVSMSALLGGDSVRQLAESLLVSGLGEPGDQETLAGMLLELEDLSEAEASAQLGLRDGTDGRVRRS